MIKRTLYFSNPAYLSLSQNQLKVQLPEVETNKNLPEILKKEATASIPIEDIGLIVLDHSRITLTTSLMASLAGNNCAVLWCNEKHMPYSINLPFADNDTFAQKVQYQLNATEPLKKQLWRQTVIAKIENQATVLKNFGYNGLPLNHMAGKVKSGDTENYEARAAAYYWNVLLKPYKVTRGQHEGPPNHLLNYGYALLRATIARSLVGSGCLPIMGIHHHNKYNAYCLADDIMEPYRPIVDQYVFEYISKYFKNVPIPEELSKEMKIELLKIPQLDVVIEAKNSPLMVASQRTTASLAKCYAGESRKIIYPDM